MPIKLELVLVMYMLRLLVLWSVDVLNEKEERVIEPSWVFTRVVGELELEHSLDC